MDYITERPTIATAGANVRTTLKAVPNRLRMWKSVKGRQGTVYYSDSSPESGH